MNIYRDTDFSNKTLDGTSQHLTIYTNKAYNEYVPIRGYDYTNLKITNSHHDVNLINKNFINVTAKFNLHPQASQTWMHLYFNYGLTQAQVDATINTNYSGVLRTEAATPNIGKKLYVGWKNSSEIIEEMTVYNNGRETGYQQVHADRENYLESTKFITATDKDLERDCHLAYYNYKNNITDEVPGLIIEDSSSIIAPTNTFHNVVMKYPLADHTIFPLKEKFILDFTHLNPFTDINTWSAVSAAEFNKIVDISQDGRLAATMNCVEWEDFIFNYDYDKTGGTQYVLIEHVPAVPPLPDGSGGVAAHDDEHTYATELLFIADVKANPTWDIKINAGAADTFNFLRERAWQWTTAINYPVEIPLIIPLKDLPAFNSMDVFEKPFGDITLRMMLGPRSLLLFTGTDKCKQYRDTEFVVSDFQITTLTCECYGYNFGDNSDSSVWAPLKSKFGEGSEKSRIYESRFTVFKSFDTTMEGGRFNIEFPTTFNMVKYIHMTFPKTSADTTVFRNPFLKDVKLKIDGVLYPREENIRTDSRMFYHMQSMNNDFDDDITYSYTCPALNATKNGPLPDSMKKDDTDDTNFILTYELSTGHFMAMSKYGDNVNIHFSAEIIHFLQSMYGMSDAAVEYSNNEPCPQIWFTHDSCWKLNLRDGLVFMKNTCPSYDLYNNNGQDIYYMK